MTMPEILRRKLMERIDIASEPDDGEVLEEIDRLILGEEETRYLPVAQKAELRRQLFYSVRRLDVLQELLEDAGITEIMVNGYQHIFVERNGRIERYGKSFTSAEKLEDVIQQIVGRCNRVVNEQNPIVDARLENGDRVNVVMKPVALNGPILTIRRFPEQAVTMEFLVSIGSITKEAAEFLQALVRTRYSMMIGGATGSGKTTFLNLLLGKYEYSGKITSSVKFGYFPFDFNGKKENTLEEIRVLNHDFKQWELERELSKLSVREEVLERPFQTLSKGEQTKVKLAVLFLKEKLELNWGYLMKR